MRVCFLLIPVLLAACSVGSSSEDDLREQGKAIAEANCASCHAIGTSSESPHADAPPFRILSERYPVDSLQEALAEGIVVGHADMPEFRFEPDEIEALLAYMKSVQIGK